MPIKLNLTQDYLPKFEFLRRFDFSEPIIIKETKSISLKLTGEDYLLFNTSLDSYRLRNEVTEHFFQKEFTRILRISWKEILEHLHIYSRVVKSQAVPANQIFDVISEDSVIIGSFESLKQLSKQENNLQFLMCLANQHGFPLQVKAVKNFPNTHLIVASFYDSFGLETKFENSKGSKEFDLDFKIDEVSEIVTAEIFFSYELKINTKQKAYSVIEL